MHENVQAGFLTCGVRIYRHGEYRHNAFRSAIASQQANILTVMRGSLEFIIVLPLTFHYIQDQNKHNLHASVRENFFHILFHFT